MEPLVIYHANCYDGFTAAWVARKAMPGCELFPADFGDDPPDVAGRLVYVIDFSYPRDVMIDMDHAANALVVLDHHKTAEANCHGLEFCDFDMNRSGAGMAWDHFFPDKERPGWINCVEDRDLWRFEISGTAAVHACISSVPMTMENWDEIDDTTVEDLEAMGASILRYIETSISKAIEQARELRIGVYDVVALNVPYQNCSETGHALLAAYPNADYSVTYYQDSRGCWRYSLRSRPGFDVSEVAARYGGGGHAQAAGFESEQLMPVFGV